MKKAEKWMCVSLVPRIPSQKGPPPDLLGSRERFASQTGSRSGVASESAEGCLQERCPVEPESSKDPLQEEASSV